MRRAALILVLALAALPACRRRSVPTQPQELEGLRLGGGAPVQPEYADNTGTPRHATTALAAAAQGDAGAKPAAPRRPAVPTVSQPYAPDVNGVHVPMWKQRAKFY